MLEVSFGDNEFSIGMTDVDGHPPARFGRCFFIIKGQRHEVEAYGEPLGGYIWALSDGIELLNSAPEIQLTVSYEDAAVIAHLLYGCKYGHTRASAQILENRFGVTFPTKISTFLYDRELGVFFLPDSTGGNCAGFVPSGDDVFVVGLSEELGLLQTTVSKTKITVLLKELHDWMCDQLKTYKIF
jgi:hypothetical protein